MIEQIREDNVTLKTVIFVKKLSNWTNGKDARQYANKKKISKFPKKKKKARNRIINAAFKATFYLSRYVTGVGKVAESNRSFVTTVRLSLSVENWTEFGEILFC